jgi:hypothetical protein
VNQLHVSPTPAATLDMFLFCGDVIGTSLAWLQDVADGKKKRKIPRYAYVCVRTDTFIVYVDKLICCS